MDTKGIPRLPLRKTFPGLGNLLACCYMVMAASEARLYLKNENEGLVLVELKVPRTRTPLLSFNLQFASQEHAQVFMNLAKAKQNGIAKYCFKSADDSSLMAIPEADYKELFQVFEMGIVPANTNFSTALELRSFSVGLDVILNVLSQMINMRTVQGKLAYDCLASLSRDSKRLTIDVKHSNTTVLCVSFSRQVKEFDAEAWRVTCLLNAAFSYRAPVELSAENDCFMEITIGKPDSDLMQAHIDTLMKILGNSTPPIA